MRVALYRSNESWRLRPLVWIKRGNWPGLCIAALGYYFTVGK